MSEDLRISHALNELSRKYNGYKAVEILCIVTYFASENIHRRILLGIVNNEKELEASVALLEQFSLVYLNEDKTVINIFKTVQKVMLKIIETQDNKYTVLEKASGILFMQHINSLNLDHAISVWNHLTSFPQKIEKFINLACRIIEEFISQTRYKEGDLFGRKALDFVNEVLGEDNLGTRVLQHNMGLLLGMAGKHEESLELLLPSYENNREHEGLREILITIARQLGELSRFDEALQIFKQSIFRNKKVSEANDDLTLSAWHEYAHLLTDMERYYEASEILKDILKRRKQIPHNQNDDTLTLMSSLGDILLKDSKYSEALKAFYKVFDGRKAALGKDHELTLKAKCDIAMVFQHQGKLSEASAIYEEVAEKFRKILSHEHPETWVVQAKLATLFEEKGEYQKALEIYRYIHKKQTEALGEKDPDCLGVKYHIVTILFILERHDEALQTLQEVHAAYIEVFGPNHPKTVDLRTGLETLNSVNLETIFSAAWKGNLNKVKSMMQSGIDINNTDFHKKTPLHYAAEHGHLSVVEFLLTNGAIYNAESEDGETPFQVTKNNEIKNLLALVGKLMKDARDGIHENVSKHIVAEKGIVNAKDNDGSNALHWAAYNGHENIVRLLLENGANATQVTNKGNTPLHIATSKGHAKIIEILIQHIERDDLHDFINAKTTARGVTCIHVAAKNRFLDIFKLLLKHGAVYNIKNKQGKTPLHVSKDENITNLLKLSDELFQYAKNGNAKIFSKLERVESDEFIALTSARNDEGKTLLQVITANRHENLADILENSQKTRSRELCPNFEYNLEQIEKLKRTAELHIRFSEIFLRKLLSNSHQSRESKKNPCSTWTNLMEGSFYLEKVYQLIEEYKACTNGLIVDTHMKAINAALVKLEFDPEHITVGYTNEAYDGRVECFVSKGQGKKYHGLLHSRLIEDVRLFVQIAERDINSHVKKFLESFKQKLKCVVSERLLKVIENNNYLEVEDCIRDGVDVNSKNSDGRAPLHYAVNNGNLDIVKFLLKIGADVTQATAKGNTPLHIATSRGNKEIVQVLLQHASRGILTELINAQTTIGGTTSLHVAAKNGSLDIVKSLLKKGAIFDIKNKEGKRPVDLSEDPNIVNLLEITNELFQRARNGDLGIILKLRDMEPDQFSAVIDARNIFGDTLLQVVVNNKHAHLESELLELLKTPDETQPLSSLKCRLNELKTFESFAERHLEFSGMYLPKLRNMSAPYEWEKNKGAWSATKEGSYYLGNAYRLVEVYKDSINGLIQDENIQAIHDMLVELQFDPKYNTAGYTDEAYGGKAQCFVSKGQGMKYYGLLHSEWNRDVRLFVRLVEYNIDAPVERFLKSIVKQKLEEISERLLNAVKNNNYSEVEDCIRAEGFDVNLNSTYGGTALHIAVNNGNLDITNILLKNGAEVTQVTSEGNTPLHIATAKDFEEIVKILLQHASFNKLNNFINVQTIAEGMSSLHIAARNGRVDVVKFLLKYGAIHDIKNSEGKTPLDLSEDLNVINLLKLTQELFQGANNGDLEIISKLRHTESHEFIAIANARDNKGNTLLEVAMNNKYKSITSEFLELFKKPGKIKSWSSPKNELERFEMLQEIAELHIKISQLYILELRCISEPWDSENYSLPSVTIKNGFCYLRNAHGVVEICKWCAHNSIDNEYIRAINDMLITLEFHSDHTMSCVNEACDEEVAFILTHKHDKLYYKLLCSGLKKDVKSFIKLVERNIESNVNKFVDSIKKKLQELRRANLFEAIKDNDQSEVEGRIKDGIDVNCKNVDGSTLLHCAVNNGNLEMINILLKYGADYTQVTTEGNTLLHIATSKDLKEIVKFLLQQVSPDKFNSFINAQSVGGTTSLHVAAKNGSWDIVKCLLMHGATYNIKNEEGKTPLDLSTHQNITKLLKSIGKLFQDAKSNYPRILENIQSNQVDEFMALTNARNNEGNTLMQVVANESKDTMVKIAGMIRRNENLPRAIPKLKLDQIEKLKDAAESCIKCSEAYLPMLRNTSQSNRSEKNSFPWATLKAGSYYLRDVHGLVAVYEECMHGSIDDVNIQAVDDILVELEFDPKHITLGYTDEAFDGKVKCFVSKGQGTKYYELLHSKLKKDVRAFVKIIEPDIDIYVKRFLNSIEHELKTFLSDSLFHAIKSNNIFEVKNCLREESVNSISTDGKTPLHHAVESRNVDIINILLKHGADVILVDYQGATPLHTAVFRSHEEVVNVLLDHVSRDKVNRFINIQCRRGFTALHIAAYNGLLEVVESLLQHGAIYDMKNVEGKTALDLSNDRNVTNLLKLIETVFGDAKNGSFKIMHKLKIQSNKLTAITNTRNHQGKSLVQVAVANKHQSLALKLLEIIKTKSNSTED